MTMTAAITIEHIALGKLVPSKENVRRTNSQAGIVELAASIDAHGLIQNLTVRKGAKGKFEVVAGARRLAALRLLEKDGRFEKNLAIPCNVLAKADDTEISLAENMMRSAMNPVDEIEAFRKLSETGMTPEAIGDRFGMSHMTVRRRLKLAHLSPRILDAMRADEVTQQQAEALALSDDHAAQEAAWFSQPYAWQREPRALREILSKEQMRGNHRLAQFITVEAYREAGGEVITDLFSEAGDSYLTDRALVVKLAGERLALIADEQVAAGWSWAEPDLEGNAHHGGSFRRIHARVMEPSEEQAEESTSLANEYDELVALLESENGSEEELEAASNRIDAIEKRQDDLRQSLYRYDPAEVAHAGCLVSVDYHGAPTIAFGMVREEDWPAILALRGQEPMTLSITGSEVETEAENDNGTLSAALIEELTAIRTAALRVEMTRQPGIALAAILHPLVVRAFYTGTYGLPSMSSAVEVRGEFKQLETAIQSPASHSAFVEWTAHMEGVKGTLPHEPGLLWDWLTEQETPTLLDLLATVSAANTNAIRYRHDTRKDGRGRQADKIAGALRFDMAAWWTPNTDFLERLSKKALGSVMRSRGITEDRIASMQKLPKYEAVIRTHAEIGGSGYMPECLMTPAEDMSQEAHDSKAKEGVELQALAVAAE